MIAVRFLADHGPRSKGDEVRYDDASAAHLVNDAGVAEYVDETVDARPAGPSEQETGETEVEVEHTPTGAEAPQTASADGD